MVSERLARRSQLRGQPRHGRTDAAPRSRLIPSGNHPSRRVRADADAVNVGGIFHRRFPRRAVCRSRISDLEPKPRLFRYFLGGRIAAICVTWLLTVHAAASASIAAGTAAHNEVIFVVAGGWHTEIAVPTELIGGPLASLTRGFAGAPYVIFGWGARDYHLAHNPGIADLLRAATPGPAATGSYDLSHTCNTWTAEALHAAGVPMTAAGVVFAGQLLDQLRSPPQK